MQNFKPFWEIDKPFNIGLKPINENTQFLHIDHNKDKYINEKKQLYKLQFNDIFMQEDNTIDSQNEVKKIIEKEINQKIPNTQLPPLAQTALHIQDDLIIMRKQDGKWRLVAGSLCFPSSWNLKEKFGKPIEAIHQPVPYMEGKMNDRINRIFNALKTNEPLWRQNWSIKNDNILRHDTIEGKEKMLDCSKPIFIRWEYQTLHKLPISEDILFTIKILIQPIKEIIKNDGGQKIVGSLKTYFEEMGEDGRKYKRIDDDEFIKWINKTIELSLPS